MTLDEQGKKLLAECEGLRLKPYLCPAGKATIGLGNTFYENGTPVKMTDAPITPDRALMLFEYIKGVFEKPINDHIKVPLKQCQFNALFIFAYNVGAHAFINSDLLKCVNTHSGDVAGISTAFHNWDGKVLKSRRQKEINEYFRN